MEDGGWLMANSVRSESLITFQANDLGVLELFRIFASKKKGKTDQRTLIPCIGGEFNPYTPNYR